MSATPKALEELHQMLATHMRERLSSGEATASELNVIARFLRDNGIQSIPKPGNVMAGLEEDFQDALKIDLEQPFDFN